jgi:hypothetical protein
MGPRYPITVDINAGSTRRDVTVITVKFLNFHFSSADRPDRVVPFISPDGACVFSIFATGAGTSIHPYGNLYSIQLERWMRVSHHEAIQQAASLEGATARR